MCKIRPTFIKLFLDLISDMKFVDFAPLILNLNIICFKGWSFFLSVTRGAVAQSTRSTQGPSSICKIFVEVNGVDDIYNKERHFYLNSEKKSAIYSSRLVFQNCLVWYQSSRSKTQNVDKLCLNLHHFHEHSLITKKMQNHLTKRKE